MAGLDINLILQLMGGVFFLAGLAGVFGIWKGWYWRSQNSAYGYIPLGLLFIVAAYEKQLRQLFSSFDWAVTAIYVVLFGLGIWGFVRPPRSIKPWWARAIETQPKEVYKKMAQLVNSGEKWQEHLASPEALDAWIRVVKRKKLKSTKK